MSASSSSTLKTQKKEIELIKTADLLGLTLCNGDDGQVTIRHIAPGSIAARAPHAIKVGDIIEKINGEEMVGKGHREVSAKLKAIPLGTSFQLRLITMRPIGNSSSSNFTTSTTMTNNNSILGLNSGKSSGLARKASQNSFERRNWECRLMNRLSTILADHYGFDCDDALVRFMWTLLCSSTTREEFGAKVGSDLDVLQVPGHVIEQIWNTIGPAHDRTDELP